MQSLVFNGYPRPDGQVGARNQVGIIYTVDCARFVSEEIAKKTRNGTPFGWFNCYTMANNEDSNILIGLGRNPNIGAALVVGLGCEGNPPSKVADGISKTGKDVEVLTIQGIGGTKRTIQKGTTIAKRLSQRIMKVKRRPYDMSSLTLGVKCGGSDATSALSANPILGLTADKIVENGGRILSSELTELAGCEHLVARRAKSDVIGKEATRLIRSAVSEFESRFGSEHSMMSPGNIYGGLTTIEEKSLGALMKTGHSQLQGVLQPGEYPNHSGWYLVDGLVAKNIRHFGLEADGEPTDLAAAGAQVIIFTTGRGSADGNVISPTIKVCANPQTYRVMRDDMDFNAGAILEGKLSMGASAKLLLEKTLKVASGEMTKSEQLGHREGGMIMGGRPLATAVKQFCE
jgi:altronate dehydratase large subunit